VSGPYQATNGQLTFTNATATAGGCPGNQTAFIQNSQVRIAVYECSSGAPRFNSKTGAQTNTSCTLVTSSPA
jgi:hypothetical protein